MVEVVRTETAAQFFRRRISRALERQKVETSEESTFYLVELLESFIRPDRLYARAEVEPDQPLAEVFCTAVTSEGMRKFLLLKFSGDMSLFISGLFPDSLERSLVDVDYYIQLGGSAYATAAEACRAYANAALFRELALNFGRFVDVLNEVSEGCSLSDDSNLLRLYESYLRTRSPRSERRLRRRGFPLLPDALDDVH